VNSFAVPAATSFAVGSSTNSTLQSMLLVLQSVFQPEGSAGLKTESVWYVPSSIFQDDVFWQSLQETTWSAILRQSSKKAKSIFGT